MNGYKRPLILLMVSIILIVPAVVSWGQWGGGVKAGVQRLGVGFASVLFPTSSGTPSSSVGVNGSVAVDTVGHDLYVKSGASWRRLLSNERISTTATSGNTPQWDSARRLYSADPGTNNAHVATRGWVNTAIAAAGGAEVTRWNGSINGNTGPNADYTWSECALISAARIDGRTGGASLTLSWHEGRSGGDLVNALSRSQQTYYDIQSECDDGVCQVQYAIQRGVLICGD